MANMQLIDAIYSLALEGGDFKAIARAAGCDEEALESESHSLFSRALDCRNAEDLESIFMLRRLLNESPIPGTREEQIRICERLCSEDWHILHEDVVGQLQNFASPSSVVAIQRAISLKPKLVHLDYDDYGSFYKKCLWALAAIGTDEAILAIKNFTGSSDSELSKEAAYRMSKILTKSRKV